MKRSIAIAVMLIFVALPASAKPLTVAWTYNPFYFQSVIGFKLYSGTEVGSITTLVADIKKEDVTATETQPPLIKETFDTDPGNKYNVTQGSWEWVSKTKNMKFSGDTFMVVFEVPAGTDSAMSYTFWPLKSTGNMANLYSYIKDEAASTDGGVYYELRAGDVAGLRTSNWRKVYDKKYGGIDPNGAFPLPRYKQCQVASSGETLCPGFAVRMWWNPEEYNVELEPQSGSNAIASGNARGVDVNKRALNINKLEIITKQQEGWIDNIIIGGEMEVKTKNKIEVPLPASGPVYLAVTAYNDVGESWPSVPGRFEEDTGGPVILQAPKNMTWRKVP